MTSAVRTIVIPRRASFTDPGGQQNVMCYEIGHSTSLMKVIIQKTDNGKKATTEFGEMEYDIRGMGGCIR